MDYQNTPSYYNNEEYFSKYLGNTSYYTALQNVVYNIVRMVDAKSVLEMGSALGSTSLMLAKQFPDVQFKGIDLREDIVIEACKAKEDQENLHFSVADMCEYAKRDLEEYDLIFMLYSFHHILDPLNRKTEFLKNCFKNMKPGSYLLVAETFLPDNLGVLKEDERISALFRLRCAEGYASTFWSSLHSLSEEGIAFAHQAAEVSRSEETLAGTLVNKREGEYLVEFSWLLDQASECGFKIVIAEPVNTIMEKAVLLRR